MEIPGYTLIEKGYVSDKDKYIIGQVNRTYIKAPTYLELIESYKTECDSLANCSAFDSQGYLYTMLNETNIGNLKTANGYLKINIPTKNFYIKQNPISTQTSTQTSTQNQISNFNSMYLILMSGCFSIIMIVIILLLVIMLFR